MTFYLRGALLRSCALILASSTSKDCEKEEFQVSKHFEEVE